MLSHISYVQPADATGAPCIMADDPDMHQSLSMRLSVRTKVLSLKRLPAIMPAEAQDPYNESTGP